MNLQSGARADYSRGDLCLSATALTGVLAPAATASAPGRMSVISLSAESADGPFI
jgi:hypothetical protein